MNTELINKCDLLVKNRDIVQKAYPWNSGEMTLAAAAIYVGFGKVAETDKLKACEAIVKKNAGIFSQYRGYVEMPLLCKMAMSEDPEQYFHQIQAITEQMKNMSVFGGEYIIMAAMTIYEHAEPDTYAQAIETTRDLYEKMKKNHPWITSGEDIPFAAMLAVSGVDADALIDEMENCYQTLKKRFSDANAVQSLSHVLAADPAETELKCERVEAIFDLLKEMDHKYGAGTELPVLGALSLFDLPAETIAADIVEADDYLKKQQGFGDFLMGAKTRRMYAALLTLNTVAPASETATNSAVAAMLSLALAMEILTICMISSICISMSSH